MISFEEVEKYYLKSSKRGLNKISFKVQKGEFVFISGHSGAGKSTLLKLIPAIERPTHGKVFVAGQDLTQIPNTKIPFLRRKIGMVFQNNRLLYNRTVFDNIALPLQILGMDKYEIKKKIQVALDRVLLSKEDRYLVKNLSIGQQQRVGIARAIVHKPELLLADEPTGNLDSELALETMSIFEDINYSGTSVLVATHDLSLVAQMRHRMLVLQNGKLLNDGDSR